MLDHFEHPIEEGTYHPTTFSPVQDMLSLQRRAAAEELQKVPLFETTDGCSSLVCPNTCNGLTCPEDETHQAARSGGGKRNFNCQQFPESMSHSALLDGE